MATSSVCDFCSIGDCNLGVQKFEKVPNRFLRDILELENKKKQKISDKLMKHNQKELVRLFNLGEGFQYQKFNNLALDKLRTDRDNAGDLGNNFKDKSSFIFNL